MKQVYNLHSLNNQYCYCVVIQKCVREDGEEKSLQQTPAGKEGAQVIKLTCILIQSSDIRLNQAVLYNCIIGKF
jgi:hypothetical protein